MTIDATIYARFSNHEQAQGNSRDRQLRLCLEMVYRHRWSHNPANVIVDEGKSAFAGINRVEGSGLGEFEAKVRAGTFLASGHVLVVENLDRISRQGYNAILPFLSEMTRNGVTVAIADGDRVYRACEDLELGPVIEAVVKAELAREESDKKSKRLRAAQQRKVEQAQEYARKGQYVATTRIAPAWIDVDPVTYEMTVNEPRVRVLREIFRLTIEGYGTPAIGKLLNQRGEPVWNNRGIRSKNGWTVGYLTKLVTNKAVMGEARPMNKPRHGKATSRDIVILNRYPQAIDPVTFARAQAARQSRKNSSGAWQITHGNLFSGIAKCGRCGGRMKQEVTARAGQVRRSHSSQSGYPARRDISYLKCHNAINRVTDEKSGNLKCTNSAFLRYEVIESAVLNIALHLAAINPATTSTEVSALEIELANSLREIEEKQRQLDNLVRSFGRTGSPSFERAALSLEEEVRLLKAHYADREAELQHALASTAAPDHLAHVRNIKTEMNSSDSAVRTHARMKMKQVLNNHISTMECWPTKEVHLILDHEIGMIFDRKGNMLASQFLRGTITGHEGQVDWIPCDEEAHLAA